MYTLHSQDREYMIVDLQWLQDNLWENNYISTAVLGSNVEL